MKINKYCLLRDRKWKLPIQSILETHSVTRGDILPLRFSWGWGGVGGIKKQWTLMYFSSSHSLEKASWLRHLIFFFISGLAFSSLSLSLCSFPTPSLYFPCSMLNLVAWLFLNENVICSLFKHNFWNSFAQHIWMWNPIKASVFLSYLLPPPHCTDTEFLWF